MYTMGRLFYLILLMACMIANVSAADGESLQRLTQCVCVGDELVYQCTAIGSGSTIWSGSIFQCPSNDIDLRHLLFPNAATGACNNQSLIAKSVSLLDNHFTSQLNITSLNVGMNGGTVMCDHYDGASREVIGNTTIVLSNEVQPPTNLRITDSEYSVSGDASISLNITISWDETIENCPSLRYQITSSAECGSCPQESTGTTVKCTGLIQSETYCTISVQSVICNTNLQSDRLSYLINLRVPGMPTLDAIPRYNDRGTLESITVNITTAMNILKFATNYTIRYVDPVSNMICGSATIPDSSCEGGICHHVFNTSLSSCPLSTNISVTAFSTNIFGEGDTTEGILIGWVNQFVNVQYTADSMSIICNFVQNDMSTNKSCIVLYGECDQQRDLYASDSVLNSSNSSLRVKLESALSTSQFCFIVTASNGTYTVTIGFMLPLKAAEQLSPGVIAAIIVPVILITVILIAGIVTSVCYSRKQKHKSRELEQLIVVHPDDRDKLKTKRFNNITRLEVNRDCELSNFLGDHDLNLRSHTVYYQFVHGTEKISSDQEVLCMHKELKKDIFGVSEEGLSRIGVPGESVKCPQLRHYHIFIQSKGAGRRKLQRGSHILYEPKHNENFDGKKEDLIPVEKGRFKVFNVHGDCELKEFIEDQLSLVFEPGCAFYEFCNDEQDVSERKEVILMNKNSEELFTGPGALQMIGAPGHDIQKPDLPEWIVFIQSRYNGCHFLSDGSRLLYENPKCRLEKDDSHRFEILPVSKNYMLKKFVLERKQEFIVSKVYFEFTSGKEDINDGINIVLMDKDNNFYSGPNVRKKIGLSDGISTVWKPDLKGYRVFVQSSGGGQRFLRKGTNVLYDTYGQKNVAQEETPV